MAGRRFEVLAASVVVLVGACGGGPTASAEGASGTETDTGDLDPFVDCVAVYDQDVYVTYPADSAQLDALSDYDCIRGSLRIWGTIQTEQACPEWECDTSAAESSESLAPLSGLRHVGGDVEVGATPLADLEFLDGLEQVDGDMRLQKNLLMTRLGGPSRLEHLGGALRILDNASLTTIEGFDALTSTGGVELGYDGFTVDLDTPSGVTGLSALTEIDGDFVLEGSQTWPSTLEGLSALQNVTGELRIGRCSGEGDYLFALRDLHGLEQLETIGGDFVVGCAAGMDDLDALESLREIGGDALIGGNPFHGTNAIRHLGLDSLERIGGRLAISNYEELVGLESLEQVHEVTELYLDYLPALDPESGLDGLDGLERVDGELTIIHCGVEQPVAEAFASGVDVTGEVTVCANGPMFDGPC